MFKIYFLPNPVNLLYSVKLQMYGLPLWVPIHVFSTDSISVLVILGQGARLDINVEITSSIKMEIGPIYKSYR